MVWTLPKKCSGPVTTLGWPERTASPGAVVPTASSDKLTPMRVLTGMICSCERAAWKVLAMITPRASVSIAVLVVPASVRPRRSSSPSAAWISSRLARSALWTRLRVTGSKTAGRDGSGDWRRQRIQDWITSSLTMPEGRMPSSKKRRRASATRCSCDAKNGWGEGGACRPGIGTVSKGPLGRRGLSARCRATEQFAARDIPGVVEAGRAA